MTKRVLKPNSIPTLNLPKRQPKTKSQQQRVERIKRKEELEAKIQSQAQDMLMDVGAEEELSGWSCTIYYDHVTILLFT